MKRSRSLSLLAVLVTLTSTLISAQDNSVGVDPLSVMGTPKGQPLSGTTLDQHTDELTSTMRCPVCQGLSIADSDTAIAMAMKEEVRQFLAAGYTDEQVLAYFEASYGEFIRLEPKPTGFNLLVWIAPIGVLLLGLMLVIRRLRSAPPTPSEPSIADPADDLDSYRERVRREVTS